MHTPTQTAHEQTSSLTATKANSNFANIQLYAATWQVLKIFNLYRFFLCATLLLLNFYNLTFILGKYNATLFLYTSVVYILFSLCTLAMSIYKRPSYYVQVIIIIFADILFLTILLNCSGGIASGLSMLFIPVIAAASLLSPGRVSFLFTAMASIAILAEQTFTYLYQSKESVNFIASGLSGITLFAAAIVINTLYSRLHASEALTKLQINVLADLEKLNSLIIQKLHVGVIVVDQTNKLRMINSAAKDFLNLKQHKLPIDVSALPEYISPHITASMSTIAQPTKKNMLIGEKQLSVEIINLEHTDNSKSILVFLEDLSKHVKKVQEMKLISIGRITANIAHEIRNPLAAISHATELLHESSTMEPENSRLLDIVHSNTARVNNVIENILLLSKAKSSKPQQINLASWFNHFKQHFFSTETTIAPEINIKITPPDLCVYMDETQLHQIITNLTENGLRYSMQNAGKPSIEYIATKNGEYTYLDVLDHGPGVEPANMKYLFEPFFTTNPTGTGLGLYMARELCQANNAKLEYCPGSTPRGHFRIIFTEAAKN